MNEIRRRQACAQSDHEPGPSAYLDPRAELRSEEPGQVVCTCEPADDVATLLNGPWGRPFVELSWNGREPVVTEIPAERALAAAWRL